MKIHHLSILFGILYMVAMGTACSKDDPNPPDNPYNNTDTTDTDTTTIDTSQLVAGSFQWLHAHVFAPTCANSGCHDGTFEPEFRTIQGSYNTLVNRNSLKMDTINHIRKRVVPYKADSSMLYLRITQFLPNSSGIMPLQTDPNSDWEARQTEYIQAIRTWINNGAPNN